MKNKWAYWVGGVIVLAGVLAGVLRQVPSGNGTGPGAMNLAVGPKKAAVPDIKAANNLPVVTGFKGDVEDGGIAQNDGTTIPFVIGDILKLDAETLNAIEYRWVVDGEVIKDKDQEWSKKPDREWEVKSGGDHVFSVQVRGSDPTQLSQPREKTLKTEKLYIRSFEANLTEEEDRGLTGSEYTVEVDMAEPLTADNDFYRFRYSINDEIIKHPEDGEEWTTETSLTYTFPAAGKYTFKVEVRRATEKEVEASATMAQTIEVADAVLLKMDAYPDNTAALGTTVNLDSFPTSTFGKSEVRFGVRRIDAADFDWIPEQDGTMWGDSEREWRPTEPGTYIVRAEIREPGKTQADDHRELKYTITEGGF